MMSVFSAVFVWLVAGSVGMAQSADRSEQVALPAAPADYILDEASFFRDAPEKRREVSDSLKAIRDTHGYPVYLVIYYSVFEGTLDDKAKQLQGAWIGENGHGMVIVYQRDPVAQGSNPAIAYFRGSELDVEQRAVAAKSAVFIPERDAKGILTRVFESATKVDSEASSVDFMCAFVFNLERELKEYFAVTPPKWNDSDNLRSILIFGAAVAVLSLLGMLIWKISSRSDSRSSQKHYFPEVKTGRRLGAPFAGGWTSERTFVPSSSRK